jgi:hypothetical protein
MLHLRRRIGFEHALDFGGIDSGLSELGAHHARLFANELYIQHEKI